MSSLLNHSPAEIIRQLIIDLSLGTMPTDRDDWPVSVDAEPDSPDNCITITDTTGHDDGQHQPTGELREHYGIQIRIRAVTHPVGWVKTNTLRKTLSENVYLQGVSVQRSGETATYYTVHALGGFSSVLRMGKDIRTSKRRLFSLNLIAAIEQVG